MPTRLPSSLIVLGFAVMTIAVAACGGGGGGSSVPTPVSTATLAPGATPTATPKSTPTPTPFPGTSPSPCPSTGTGCPYAFNSDPLGTTVYVNGKAIGVTPISTTPPFSATAATVTFGTSSYSATIDQTGSASHIVFYNSIADTGTVSVSGTMSLAAARQAATVRRSSGVAIAARPFRSYRSMAGLSSAGVYVKYDASKLTRSIASIEASAGVRSGSDILSSVAAIRGRIVRPQSGTDVRSLAAALGAQPGVIGVYPLHKRFPLSVGYVDPSDAFFGSDNDQWDMAQMQATYAWSITQGSNATVAIIDTGIDDTQPDFSHKIVREVSIVDGMETVGTGSAMDTDSHGTNVAGVADAQTNDATAFAGVGYNAKLLVYGIFEPDTAANGYMASANTADEATAIADAVANHADVINLSLGSPQYDPPSMSDGFDQAEHDAVEAAIASGVVVVAASGNGDSTDFGDGVRLATVDFPAAYDGVISVGATALSDNNAGSFAPATGVISNATEVVAAYSNYGPTLSVVAPGGDTSLSSESDTSDYLHWVVSDGSTEQADRSTLCSNPTPGQCKYAFQGTSQAAPHVAGTVALVQSALREHNMTPLSPAAMLQLIEGTADNINDPYQGHGRVNALRAVASAIGLPLVNAAVPTPPPSSPTQFVAFAYTNSGASPAIPAIADETYPTGVPLTASNTFRIADIDPARTTGTFKIGVWLDVNGDGIVDAGDLFGVSSVTCTATAPCQPGSIAVSQLTTSGPLP